MKATCLMHSQWLSSVLLQKKSRLWGLRVTLVLTTPRRTRAWGCRISVSFHHLHISHQGHMAVLKRQGTNKWFSSFQSLVLLPTFPTCYLSPAQSLPHLLPQSSSVPAPPAILVSIPSCTPTDTALPHLGLCLEPRDCTQGERARMKEQVDE